MTLKLGDQSLLLHCFIQSKNLSGWRKIQYWWFGFGILARQNTSKTKEKFVWILLLYEIWVYMRLFMGYLLAKKRWWDLIFLSFSISHFPLKSQIQTWCQRKSHSKLTFSQNFFFFWKEHFLRIDSKQLRWRNIPQFNGRILPDNQNSTSHLATYNTLAHTAKMQKFIPFIYCLNMWITWYHSHKGSIFVKKKTKK